MSAPPRRGWVLPALALGLAAALVGCAALGGPLDVPPGQRVVLGGVDLSRFDPREALLEIVRVDGTYRHDLRTGAAPGDFAITLPPGRYRVARVLLLESGSVAHPNQLAWDLPVTFEVGPAPTVYVGTLRLIRELGTRVRVEVADEYGRTVPALRRRHPEIREPIERALMRST